ncbi:Protein of unknown function [Amphibacillus marinus]|uniref:DUF3006 domain-containing protein n=1 Tax=Amphibacillus marinus TaxID=872970 RepID=A0A1H8IL53_9BACI|nr:DUF3006 family protein [Amphibacillus marinus]SEN68836.1 Protein of unknown function [Amphibacillus marinus]
MQVQGVIDRFEDQHKAVIIVEKIGQQFVVDQKSLPLDVSKGDILNLTIVKGEITAMVKNLEYTNFKKNQLDQKREQLKKRAKGSLFKERN